MSIFIFKHIFTKKGKCICMLKKKFCVACFRFLSIIILFVFVICSFIPSIQNSCICKNFLFFFFLKSETNLNFPSIFWKERVLAVYLYGHITTRRLWRLVMPKSGKNPKCSFFNYKIRSGAK